MDIVTKSLSSVHVSLGDFEVVRLNSHSVAFGVLFPQRKDQGPLLVTGDGKGLFVIPLEGKSAFRHFQLAVGTPLRGILFRDIQIRVDVGSQYNCVTEEPLGAVTIEEKQLRVVVAVAGEAYPDPLTFPLQEIAFENEQEWSLGFKSWSILKKVDGYFVELWRNDGLVIPLDR